MGKKSSLIPGFHRFPILERRRVCSDFWGDLSAADEKILYGEVVSGTDGLSKAEEALLYHAKGIDVERIGENPVGVYQKVLRVVPNLKINGRDYIAPFVTEEASVTAGLGNSAKLAYLAGGVEAKVEKSFCLGQIMFYHEDGSPLSNIVCRELSDDGFDSCFDGKDVDHILKMANEGQTHARAYSVRFTNYDSFATLDLEFDPGDAMGAAKASQMAERVAGFVAERLGASSCGSVVSNASGRLTRAKVRMPVSSQERRWKRKDGGDAYKSGEEISRGIAQLSKWAGIDHTRAVTNNKGIMNGVIGIADATAQDTRAIGAACHDLAAYSGRFKPSLSRWHVDGEYLVGEVELLLPVGIVGGEIEKYPQAKVILEKCLKVKSANELAEIAAAVSLLQNHAALSMLASSGVSVGHGGHRNRVKDIDDEVPPGADKIEG